MVMLNSISKVIQSFSDLLNIDIAYFNPKGEIIVATEEYMRQKGKQVHKPFFDTIHGHNVTFIHQPGEMNICKGCHFLHDCPSKSEIIQDMTINNRRYGYLSFVCFSPETEEAFIKDQKKYIGFLAQLNDIIISILQDHGTVAAQEYISSKTPSYIFGENSQANHIKDIIHNIRNSSSSVLLTGETGTGKSLLANYIHKRSPVRQGPFIEINCASIPENLFESELFGYDEGAFTGARAKGKPGYFELADKGTLFLDEIADLPLHLQPKLLKVLQDGIIQRVGGTASKKVDVRIISATNHSFTNMIKESKFRMDLFYRLNVVPIKIPALRKRKEDLHFFVEHSINKLQKRTGKRISGYTDDYLKQLMLHDWPGNQRELENIIEYSMNMTANDQLTINSLPDSIKNIPGAIPNKENMTPLNNAEREVILVKLKKHGYSYNGKVQVAKELGFSVRTLYRKMANLEISQNQVVSS